MTGLYESLQCTKHSTPEDITKSYENLIKFYNPDDGHDQKMVYEELTLAYNTLINPTTRAEYDEYMSQLDNLSSHRKNKQQTSEVDEEEAERRRQERGKARFQEDFDFINDEFLNSFKQRMGQNFGFESQQSKDDTNESRKFDGKNISTSINISLQESLDSTCSKEISYERMVICDSCNGTREANKSLTNSKCMSCHGKGIKKDPLFGKEEICNTCNGHGDVYVNPCLKCNGNGLIRKTVSKNITIERFTKDQEVLEFLEEGNQTAYKKHGGENGVLKVKINVLKEPLIDRQNNHITSKHFITMSEAYYGKSIEVKTIKGVEQLQINKYDFDKQNKLDSLFQMTLKNKGIDGKYGSSQEESENGHHYVDFQIMVPQNLDQDSQQLFEDFKQDELSDNYIDASIPYYEEKDYDFKKRQNFSNKFSSNSNKQEGDHEQSFEYAQQQANKWKEKFEEVKQQTQEQILNSDFVKNQQKTKVKSEQEIRDDIKTDERKSQNQNRKFFNLFNW